MTDSVPLTPRERLKHASTILAGLLASGEYHNPDVVAIRDNAREAVIHEAVKLTDMLTRDIGIKVK